jgi:hypothetical protein
MQSGLAVFVDSEFDAELSQASSIEVHEQLGHATRYAIRWPLTATAADFPRAIDARLDPGVKLSLRYQEDDAAKVLVEGPITGHSLHLEHGAGSSWIEAVGADSSVEMDRELRSQVWADVKDSDVVTSILQRYQIEPDVAPTAAMHATAKHALVQRDSDLRFIRRLARRNGYLFWLSHDAEGIVTGHFKAPPLEDEARLELKLNQHPPTTHVFDLRFDVERPTSLQGLQLDLNNKALIDVSSAHAGLPLLGADDLRAITGDLRSVHLSAPVDDGGDFSARGAAALREAGWFVQASCQTNRAALKGVLRAPSVVEVKGVGTRHSGKYFVTSVHHVVDRTVHRMSVELVRNAWGVA